MKPLLRSLARQGRVRDAEQIIDNEIGDLPMPNTPPMIGLVYGRAEVIAAAGKHAAAITEFDDAVRRGAKWGGASPSQIGDILIAARSHRALGNQEATRARIADAEKLARKWGAPGPLGEVKHAEAVLNGASDQIDMLREAVSLLERSPARLEHARADRPRGKAPPLWSAPRLPPPLKEGYDLARKCGAEPPAETARQELAASRVRVRRERLAGAESLTPSELRIAQMAVGGAANAEIAQALFVTVKTVEMHLTNIYRKLDIAGRHELPLALNRPAAPRR